jgi:hypothetical protein
VPGKRKSERPAVEVVQGARCPRHGTTERLAGSRKRCRQCVREASARARQAARERQAEPDDSDHENTGRTSGGLVDPDSLLAKLPWETKPS